jgi:hypothetical protein
MASGASGDESPLAMLRGETGSDRRARRLAV